MRAVVMQDCKLRVADVPEPVAGSGEVVVEVLRAGICGSDLHGTAHGVEFNAATKAALGAALMDLSQPIVLGHEFVGRVVAHGPDTEGRIPVGRRVVSLPALLRDPPGFIGFGTVPGGYAERMLLSEPLLIEVPDDMPTEIAALTEPLAVAYATVVKADLSSDDVPLVLGCGPIGLAVVAVLRMRGVGPIVAADFSPERRDLAKRLGADIVVDPLQASVYEAWTAAAATDDPARMAKPTPLAGRLPLRPTVAFECVGEPGIIQQLVTGAPAGSRIVVAGLCMTSDSFEPAQAVLKVLDIRFTLMYSPEEFAQAFAHLAAGEVDVAALLTDTVDLEGVADAFERLANSPSDAKILIDPSR